MKKSQTLKKKEQEHLDDEYLGRICRLKDTSKIEPKNVRYRIVGFGPSRIQPKETVVQLKRADEGEDYKNLIVFFSDLSFNM